MCSTSILSDLQNIRENPKRVLIHSDFDSARQQASNEVYFSLVMLTTGKAATIVRTVRETITGTKRTGYYGSVSNQRTMSSI